MQLQCHLCGSNSPLHALPGDPIIAEKWKEAIPDATPDVFTPNFRLCVQHFDKQYIFQKRHLMRWAVPELIHFNGKSWQKERCDYSPKVNKTEKPKTKAPNSPPPVVIQPAPSNVDESPVILPLPPRRDDEPDSDPLAVPEPVIKTPIISHVTSLRDKTQKHSPLSRSAKNSPRPSHLNDVPKVIPASAGIATSDIPRKPKISVKSPAELSAPKSMHTNPVKFQKGDPRILNKSLPTSNPSALIPFNQISPSNQKTLIIPPPPNQPQYQFIISPNPTDQQYILASPATSTQYIVTSSNAQNQTILVSEKTQGQPILFTDTGHRQPLLLTDPVNGAASQPMFFQNQPILLTAVSSQPVISQPQNSNMVISDARSLRPDTAQLTRSPKTPPQNAQLKTTSKPQIPCQPVSPHIPAKTPSKRKPEEAQSSTDSAEYTEKLTRQAIATVKADIAKTQKKSQILQKKIDLLKLKVSTYEGLISKLVSSNIISKESAKQCRVLPKDVTRFKNKRKSTEQRQENAMKKGREIIENDKENSNDTVDSLDSSAAKDHDYL